MNRRQPKIGPLPYEVAQMAIALIVVASSICLVLIAGLEVTAYLNG